jgi:hypothetical protein
VWQGYEEKQNRNTNIGPLSSVEVKFLSQIIIVIIIIHFTGEIILFVAQIVNTNSCINISLETGLVSGI